MNYLSFRYIKADHNAPKDDKKHEGFVEHFGHMMINKAMDKAPVEVRKKIEEVKKFYKSH